MIAVNEMFLRTQRDGLKPITLMIQDIEYFGDTPGYRRFLEDLEFAAHSSGADVVFPVGAHCVVTERGLFRDNPPRYYLPVGRLLNYPSAEDVPPLDFAATIPGMPTVTHTAIALALFMGFSEIYLLGVDLDFIVNSTTPIRHGYGANPYNENDRVPAAALFANKMGWDYPTLLAEVADHLRSYARLHEIAASSAQRLYNANPGGLLETVERRPYESLFQPPVSRRTLQGLP
ncbi:MAG: hypothetical protein KGJ66_10870 [Alphaproteobacteria bacterium]|nr:hypothetical protein [Alphaproteobacteria bacterium]